MKRFLRRLRRRLRRWYRETPRAEVAQTFMGIGLLLVVLAALLTLGIAR